MESNHIRVKEIFLKAIELPEEDRIPFIQKECGGDQDLQTEVSTLIENHNERSLFEAPIQKKIDPKKHKKEPSEFEITLKKIQKRKNKKFRYNLILIAIIISLISVGIWTQQKMKDSIIELNEHSLDHNIKATIKSLEEWIRDKENLITTVSKDSTVIAATEYLTSKYGMGKFGNKDSIWNDPVHRRLIEKLKPIILVVESPSFSIVDASGYRIASNIYEVVGMQMSPNGMKEILPSIQLDGPKFTRPYMHRINMVEPVKDDSEVPVTWVDCSIKVNENAIATIGFSFYASNGFNDVLSSHKIGINGHTYAFDEKGILLSEIQDVDELIKYEILKKGEDPVLKLKLINPMNALKDSKTIDRNIYNKSELILPVKEALADKEADSEFIIHTVTEPYYTFNGDEVIGAYVWLPKYNIGLVTELPTKETLKPVHYLNLILIILIGLLIGFVVFSFISSYQVARLNKEIGETSRLGQYTLIKHIGEGGMGEVYLAKHAFLSRPNAVKLLKSEFSHKRDVVKRFEREVQLASQLKNPHTIQIHDFGYTEGDRFYYAMEFLEGITLADLIRIEGSLSLSRTVVLLKQICYSLQETHDHGLVHRDIKPMNIMICKLGGIYDFVKVLDFGLVKDIEGEDLEMTQEAFIQGTPVYMAPERFLRPQLSSPKSDIYSIGMVAYYLVTGRKVFDHIDRNSLLNEILNTTPKNVGELTNENLPKDFSDLVMSCLAKDMEDRPENISAILNVLNKLDVSAWTQTEAKNWWENHIEKK
ncbi:MAG: serine/threonine protein kinase [Crocinitomicaceae bacterium]|nr:serine/threonine protein kinase [Crocinitomicaceae bacterium]